MARTNERSGPDISKERKPKIMRYQQNRSIFIPSTRADIERPEENMQHVGGASAQILRILHPFSQGTPGY